jgi:hypothetical protein
MKKSLVLLGFLLLLPCLEAAERWELRFYYDKDDSTFVINDLNFPSATRGIAVGYILKGDKTRPAAVVTSDGGQTWQFVKVRQTGLSLFFLNDSVGWMVGGKDLWKTEESGRTWRKVKSPDGILRVYFHDENHGWAVGLNKSVFETADGGRNWNGVAVADEVKADKDFTAYSWITFVGDKIGIIAGASNPPRRGELRLPDWMVPDRAARRREWPALNILLETRDAGKNWKASTTSMFGKITRMRLSPDGRGLGLIEFFNSFDWPSEVFKIEWRTGKSTRIFREKDCAVTDVALTVNGPAYLAGFAPAGRLVRAPVPGKVRLLRSSDLSKWEEMEVDYRATARRVTLAAADEHNVWAATDTGMILRLVKE